MKQKEAGIYRSEHFHSAGSVHFLTGVDRLEDLQVWEQKKVKDTKKGAKTYTYFMASWREGKRIRSVYLGSSHKMSREQAQEKARALKREALGLSSLTLPESGN